ncbi:uncharacterized protein VICG_01486 [Vittaforma corneae ATCC 50505]|uniref:Uncharacterized protein n=1 Tax=Vittaforma corneae (strain ATCC 50505) TaxID=993615 RepID=L2GMH5_VITCO|nr:uncharacterized protein VICG_01486 [Vittaforma corneae ATCC 50505]ELA41502.1 hypothetical protein VICG_01486 [Vittaforma corneae ATCC 50505]
MNEMAPQITSILQRKFYGLNPLPFPSYVLSLMFISKIQPDLGTLPLILFVTAKLVLISRMERRATKSIMRLSVFAIFSLLSYFKNTSAHSYFAEIFAFLSLTFFVEGKYVWASAMLCFLTATDPLSLPVMST